ncbi:unnamed protein product, partial [Adineta steineri]
LLWFKPITERLDENYLLQLQLISVVSCICLRICLFKPYVQTYLDTAFDRVKTLYDQQQLPTKKNK